MNGSSIGSNTNFRDRNYRAFKIKLLNLKKIRIKIKIPEVAPVVEVEAPVVVDCPVVDSPIVDSPPVVLVVSKGDSPDVVAPVVDPSSPVVLVVVSPVVDSPSPVVDSPVVTKGGTSPVVPIYC